METGGLQHFWPSLLAAFLAVIYWQHFWPSFIGSMSGCHLLAAFLAVIYWQPFLDGLQVGMDLS